MEEMILVGFQWGSFKPDGRSDRVPFASVFVLQTFPDVPADSDFHFDGLKSVKYRLASPDVVKDSGAGMFDVCEVYFNSKNVVTKIVPTGKTLSGVSISGESEDDEAEVLEKLQTKA